MKTAILVFIVLAMLGESCKRRPGNEGGEENNKDTTRFFQVGQYLQSQIKEVNATPFFIYKIEIVNSKKDSTPINTAIFNQISKQFLYPEINDEKIKKYYIENIFEDQTTKSFTISYSTTNKELPLQNVEILLNEDGHTVKRLFLRKFYNYSDSSAIEQLSWKPGESFQINRSVQKPGNQESSQQTVVVWNKNI
jgi:hypothetical protein